MKTNKILMGGIAGSVAFFLLGWLLYGILLKDFMAANGNQCMMKPMEEMIWWAMILSNVAWGFLITLILSWSNTTGFMAGAKIGAIVGLLFGLSIDLGFYSMSTMFLNLSAAFVDVICYTVMTAIGAGVIAWVLAGKKEA